MKHKKSKLKINLEYYGVVSLITMCSFLPLRICYFISNIMARILFSLDNLHRTRAIQHLMHAGIAKDEKEAREMALKNFIHFGKFAVEIVKWPQIITKENVWKYVKLNGPEISRELFLNPGKSRNAIILTGHFGNWEIAGVTYTLMSDIDMLTVMRQLDNPRIDEFMYNRRKGFKCHVTPKKGALKYMLEALNKGFSVCLLSDHHAARAESVETRFFNHPARTFASPALMHIKTGIPIVVGGLIRTGDNFNFEFVYSEPIKYTLTGDMDTDIQALAQLYTSEIEKIVRKYPEQWLWAHRRWLDINRDKNAR